MSAYAHGAPYPGHGRTSGKPNLSAPTPRMADGKPDLSGIWLTTDTPCGRAQDPDSLVCRPALPVGGTGINFGIGLPGGLPYQPWLAALVKKRRADNSKDVKSASPLTIRRLRQARTVTLRQRIALNKELVDEIFLENEKSVPRMKQAATIPAGDSSGTASAPPRQPTSTHPGKPCAADPRTDCQMATAFVRR